MGWNEDVEGVGGLKTQGLCRMGGGISERRQRVGKERASQWTERARGWRDCRHPDSHASAFNLE